MRTLIRKTIGALKKMWSIGERAFDGFIEVVRAITTHGAEIWS